MGITGARSGVSPDEPQLAMNASPTAQQARDNQKTAQRNADRALLRGQTNSAIGDFTCQSAASANTWTKCADEGGYCQLPYYTTVRYGQNGTFTTMDRAEGIPCDNATFGDPLVGTGKSCFYRNELAT